MRSAAVLPLYTKRPASRRLTSHPIAARRAVAGNRFAVPHDSDFGRLALAAKEPRLGALYLRPGHIERTFVREREATVPRGNHWPNASA